MLPVEIFPAKREHPEHCIFRSTNDDSVNNSDSKKDEVARKRNGFSFMIEDILSDSRNKNEKTHEIESSSTRSNNRPSSPIVSNPYLSSKVLSEHHVSSSSQGSNRLLPSTSSAFLPPHSPPLVYARYGYYSPAIASSPPFSSSNRSPSVFTFHTNDFNEHISATYFSQDSCARPSWCNSSAILDLTNYGQKFGSTRILPSSVIALPSTSVECPGSRQIIWKHISRSSAKRKGGQIRFTNEQTTTLENTFAEHKYLSSSERKRLATVLRLSERQVKTWFQNRRAKWRRVKQEPTCHVSSSESEDCSATNES